MRRKWRIIESNYRDLRAAPLQLIDAVPLYRDEEDRPGPSRGVVGLKLGALCKEGTMEENWSNLSLPHGKVEAVTLTEVKDALFRDEVQ